MGKVQLSALLVISFFSSAAFAELGINKCGHYKVRGYGALTGKNSYIRVFRNTKSQVSIQVDDLSDLKLIPYNNKALDGEIKVTKIKSPFSVEASAVKIKRRNPDPLRPDKDNFIQLMQEGPCQEISTNKEVTK